NRRKLAQSPPRTQRKWLQNEKPLSALDHFAGLRFHNRSAFAGSNPRSKTEAVYLRVTARAAAVFRCGLDAGRQDGAVTALRTIQTRDRNGRTDPGRPDEGARRQDIRDLDFRG